MYHTLLDKAEAFEAARAGTGGAGGGEDAGSDEQTTSEAGRVVPRSRLAAAPKARQHASRATAASTSDVWHTNPLWNDERGRVVSTRIRVHRLISNLYRFNSRTPV